MIIDVGDDGLLAEQLIAEHEARSGEHELVGAVFVDAIEVLIGRRPASPLQQRLDEVWLNSDSQGPMSFLWMCGVLKLNAKAIRQKVREARNG